METRSKAKDATVVVVRQMATPSPKQQDLQQKVSCWMDRAQSSSKLPTPLCGVKDYYSNDSFSPSLKQAFQLETEAKSSKTIVMLVMTIGTNSLEEEMAATKTMLEWPIKENKERRTSSCRRKRSPGWLESWRSGYPFPHKKLRMWGEERESIPSEASNEEVHSKKGGKLTNRRSSSVMTVEQIQDLIANAIKVQLGGGAGKNHLYTKPYTNLQNSNNLTGRATPNSIWDISSRHVITLAWMAI